MQTNETKSTFKAAVLAAGLGTRLRPLTDFCPKPLLPVLNRPLLGIVLAQLEAAGCLQVAVNSHYLADKVHDFLQAEPWSFALSVSHEPEILGTGGGLRQLAEILGPGPFLAVNGDILADLDLAADFKGHREGAVSTLVLHDCPPYNNVWVKGEAVVSIGAPPPDGAGTPLAYTGVQVVAPELMGYLPAPGQPYDLVQAWREALAAGERLAALRVSGHFWQDLGTPENYLAAHRRLMQGVSPSLAGIIGKVADPFIGPGSRIGEGVEFRGAVCLGPEVRVGEGASLKNTV
ncbi:MAG TPA: sugar phosphate nucleotidyltransferase, partial [Desulfobaccales bacterium]|nr:sugar phosphate nucleotidyltransferase [Desulfobaccales bacterium]